MVPKQQPRALAVTVFGRFLQESVHGPPVPRPARRIVVSQQHQRRGPSVDGHDEQEQLQGDITHLPELGGLGNAVARAATKRVN